MRKEIPEELYNYNKYPGLEFKIENDNLVVGDYHLSLVKNHKEAFDLTAFNQRFSEILLKYDYLVGDWSNEQLRLKGFYNEQKAFKNLNTIQRLDDYLNEYCSFGCAYFVLENQHPVEISFEEEKLYNKKLTRSDKKRQQNKRPRHQKANFEKRQVRTSKDKPKKEKKSSVSREVNQTKQTNHFVIRQKGQ